MVQILNHLKKIFGLTLREIEHIFHRFKAIITSTESKAINYYYAIYLVTVRLKYPAHLKKLLTGEWNYEALFNDINKRMKIKSLPPIVKNFRIPPQLCFHQNRFIDLNLLAILRIHNQVASSTLDLLKQKMSEFNNYVSTTRGASPERAYEYCYFSHLNESPDSVTKLLDDVEFTSSTIL
jgi:hypothetical protein